MSVHSDGSGTGWSETSPDVDQPSGLAYRELQDIRKGTRKRAEHEHSALADNTVGMLHLPGGCRVLGIVENSTDLSTGAGDKTGIDITDGLFKGRGIIYDQTNNALWCFTGDGTVSDDPYLLKFHPDRAWDGGDVTWTGAHEFDASVDITGNVAVDGDFSCDGTVVVGGDLVADGTGVEFGGTAGLGLFYDPTAYAGGESNKLPNGMIIKGGVKSVNNSGDISYAAAFPNACLCVQVTNAASNGWPAWGYVSSVGITGFSFNWGGVLNGNVHWFAIGY